jgi:hypothetical protein
MKLKTVKISTGVDSKVMGNIARFIRHSEGTIKTGLGIAKGKKRKR